MIHSLKSHHGRIKTNVWLLFYPLTKKKHFEHTTFEIAGIQCDMKTSRKPYNGLSNFIHTSIAATGKV